MSPEIRHNVVAKYIMLKVDLSHEDGTVTMNNNDNPIEWVKVLVSEMNGSVCMDKLQDDEEPREPGDRAPRRSVEQWRNAMYAKLSTTQVTLSDVQNSSISKFADVERRIRRIEEHV